MREKLKTIFFENFELRAPYIYLTRPQEVNIKSKDNHLKFISEKNFEI
jgi:hypothetical protein